MTPNLRKIHRMAWFALMPLLIIFFILSVFAIPNPEADPGYKETGPEALAVILASAENENVIIRLRSDSDSMEKQLEIQILKPLTSAASLVYILSDSSQKPENGILLGNLSGKGYRFNLMGSKIPNPKFVLIFDAVKNQNIFLLELK